MLIIKDHERDYTKLSSTGLSVLIVVIVLILGTALYFKKNIFSSKKEDLVATSTPQKKEIKPVAMDDQPVEEQLKFLISKNKHSLEVEVMYIE